MNNSFPRFGAISAILVGLLSIAYAIFYLVIYRQAELTGILGSWIILAASGIFSGAAGAQTLILISGGLTSVIVGPIWWIRLGRQPSCRLRRGA